MTRKKKDQWNPSREQGRSREIFMSNGKRFV